jgi:hypothetical protein
MRYSYGGRTVSMNRTRDGRSLNDRSLAPSSHASQVDCRPDTRDAIVERILSSLSPVV